MLTKFSIHAPDLKKLLVRTAHNTSRQLQKQNVIKVSRNDVKPRFFVNEHDRQQKHNLTDVLWLVDCISA